MTIEEMLAREAIRYTIALYNISGDGGNYDDMIGVFHPEAEMVVQQGKILKGPAEIIAGLRAGSATRGASEPGNFQKHHLTTSVIEVTSATTATSNQGIIVVTELGFDHTGFYSDEFVKHGERWLVKRRQATMTWARPDSRFVRWLGQPAKD